MARNTSELIIRGIDQASATLERIGRYGSNSMNQVSRQADIASRSMSYLKTAAISAAAALGAQKAGSWLISSNAQMEQYNQTLKVVLSFNPRARMGRDGFNGSFCLASGNSFRSHTHRPDVRLLKR